MAGIRKRALKGKKSKRKKAAGKRETLSKVDKESEVERAKASAAVWEARLKMTECSRAEYREAARSLAHNNVELTKNRDQLEKDMLDVIGFLKKQDEKKEEMIEKLQKHLVTQKKSAEEERVRLVETYKKQISCLEEECSHRAHEMQVIQSEFRMMKEFRRQKAELERELDEIKDRLLKATKDHEKALSAREKHFIEEKQRLEKEAEKKILLLAEEAHTEAVTQLGDVGRSVFTENVRLREAISYHMKESHELQKTLLQLQEEKKQLRLDKKTNQQLLEEKIHEISERNSQIQSYQLRIRTLELALESNQQKEPTLPMTQKPLQPTTDLAGNMDMLMLHQTLELKDREMKRVKKLAHNILQERTQVEQFFLEAMEHVRQEIKSSRNYYQKVAQVAYHSQMRKAATGAEQYPKVRTFHNKKHSSNDVSHDLMAADNWSHFQNGRVDFTDLTWEQKEKVLRLLFAKMNGSVIGKRNPILSEKTHQDDVITKAPLARSPGASEEHRQSVFLTQPISGELVSGVKLPDIHKTRCPILS
ncbi:basal body-orientation factor 1 [Ranitomeya variabilis]|uniref:basal body-orientation factor 1 n=1 Tax=Ranitomeya variabilis TaxID=490064 RepID=UPI004055DF04